MAGRQAFEWVTQALLTWLSKEARAAQSTSSFSNVRFKWNPPRTWAWGLPKPHPCSSQEPRQRDLGVSVRELWWGEGGCSVSPKFEFLCFSWLVLNLKKEFSVWSKLVGEREHLCRKRCSWQACALLPSYYWRVFEYGVSVCFVPLWLSFPFCLLLQWSTVLGPSLPCKQLINNSWCVHTHIHTHAENFYSVMPLDFMTKSF